MSCLSGLQYITEYSDEDPSKELQYVCTLCQLTCNSGNVVHHVMGTKHRYSYLVSARKTKARKWDTVSEWICEPRRSWRIVGYPLPASNSFTEPIFLGTPMPIQKGKFSSSPPIYSVLFRFRLHRSCVLNASKLHFLIFLQKEYYMNYYTIIRQKTCKKSELAPIIDEYARTIEEEEGRLTEKRAHFLKKKMFGGLSPSPPKVQLMRKKSAPYVWKKNSYDPMGKSFGSVC